MIKKFTDWVSTHPAVIIIGAILLLIPALIGIKKTRINYDILVYLPEEIETMKGQEILTNDFEMGAFAFVTVENMKSYEVQKLEHKIKEIPKVSQVISVNDILDISIPKEMLPDELLAKLYHENSTIVAITFTESTSHDDTLKGIEEIRNLMKDASKVSGMTSMVLDTKELSTSEMFAYIIIAAIFCLIVLTIATDSYLIPLILLGNIGISILYNMGTNIFLGEISYITKAIAAVLQLGVTMDFSIFLYHKYEQAKSKEKNPAKAMSIALQDTVKSVVGSSLTTIAGFLALCFMNLTLGKDIGLVMAKGVMCGLISAFTLFPALLLVFDSWIRKTHHKIWLPEFKKLQAFPIKHQKIILILFLLLLIPAIYGNNHVEVYYNLDESLPKTLPSSIANQNLKEEFHLVSPEVLILDKNIKNDSLNELTKELENIDGVDLVLSPKKLLEFGIPKEMLPSEVAKRIESEKYQIIIINSLYKTATKELNEQVNIISTLAKKYDENAILAGEGPLMKDLTEISDVDFKNVNFASIGIIFLIMIGVLKSLSLPILLVSTIEFAIFLNMAVAFYTKESLPFIASIIIGTIQLGATIDYAILMTSKFQEECALQKNAKDAMEKTLSQTVPSIITSALCFFAATIGVSLYSKIDLIGSICKLISRGSIISMIIVLTILPAFLLLHEKITKKLKKERRNNMKKKAIYISLLLGLSIIPVQSKALTKNETIYTTLDSTGKQVSSRVTNHLFRFDGDTVTDETELKNILNLNSNETYLQNQNQLSWPNYGKDIFYEGTTEKELPLNISIQYYLNEEEKELKEILGKEGKVKIKISFQNKLEQKRYLNGSWETLYTPFVITAGTIIKNDTNWNVNVSNGKSVNTGNKNIVLGLAASGVYESLKEEELKELNTITISYETNKMSLNNIYLVLTPKMLDNKDLQIFDKLDAVYSDMTTLQQSMNKIVAGTKNLEEGAAKLKAGSKELTDGLNNVVTNLNSLTEGGQSLQKGLEKAIFSLNEVKNKLTNSTNTNSIESLTKLSNQNIQTIQKLQATNKTLENTYVSYKLSTIKEEELTKSQMDAALIQQLLTVKKTYEANLGLITLLQTNNQAISETTSSLTNLVNQMNTVLNTLTSGLTELKNGSIKLNQGIKTLSNGINKIYSGSKELHTGTSSLYDGTQKLKNGIDTFNKQGIEQLSSTSAHLKKQTDKVKELIKLSEEYQGFASKNANDSIFIYKVESQK